MAVLQTAQVTTVYLMIELDILRTLGIMLPCAALCILLLHRLRIPNLVTYIISGLILFPLLNWFGEQFNLSENLHELVDLNAIKVITKAGIALLLFLVGLELSFEKIRDVGRVALVAGIGQVLFTALGGFILALFLNFSGMESLFIAVALTFSSTVVVVKLLDQKHDLTALYGRIAVGIFLVQDLVVIFILTILAGLNPEESKSLPLLAQSMLYAFFGMAMLLLLSLAASKYLLPRPFSWAARSTETLLLWSLTWCFLMVFLAELFGLSLEIGAFLAGISLAQLPCSNELQRRVHPLMNFFIAVFFISLGAQMDLAAARTHLPSSVLFSIFVLIGNPLIFIMIIVKMGYSRRTSFLAGVTVAQISEFSFIFAALGLQAGLIDAGILSLITLVGLITMAVSSYMILYNQELYQLMLRIGWLQLFNSNIVDERTGDNDDTISDHVILVGMNTLGKTLAQTLFSRNEKLVLIDTDPAKLQGLPGRKLIGDIDYLALLEEANFKRAKLVISTLQIADSNALLAFRCSQEDVPVVVHDFNDSTEINLSDLKIKYLLDSKAAILKEFLNIVDHKVGAVT